MKRSEINKAIADTKVLLDKYSTSLPPFGYWGMDNWKSNLSKTEAILTCSLGWDITDYGNDDFYNLGTVLFTIRNGRFNDANMGTPYAEKLLIFFDGQRLPAHYHVVKTEDIINRAGGILGIKLYNANSDGSVDYENDVKYRSDGIWYTAKAGEDIELPNGASITIDKFVYHVFYAKPGCGDLIAGEVSSVNDDTTDNYFIPGVKRFSDIIEDEEPLHPLCSDYDTFFK